MSGNSVLWSVKDAETSLRYESLNRVNVKRIDVKKDIISVQNVEMQFIQKALY